MILPFVKVYCFLLILIGVSISGCKNPAPKPPPSENRITPYIDTLTISDQKLVVHLGERDLPKMVYPLNKRRTLNGYAVEFEEDGKLMSVSHWKDGTQEGSTYVLEEEHITHQLFNQGRLVYEADYQEQRKMGNRLYPILVEEFFFEDKYYAKIRFPILYEGRFTIEVNGYQAIISPLPEQTFQLVINDALDLTEYHLELVYQPATRDTLHSAKYNFRHVVYGE